MPIDTNVTAPVNVTVAPVTKTVANRAEKPEKFNGQNFKRWQQKMFFYLTTLNLARFLKENAPQIRKNLVSSWLLNKFGFRLVFESDKFVLSKNQMYVGRGYAMNSMFKLNVMVVKYDINKINSSAYLIESSNVWHGRLGHVNFNLMRRLIKLNSIPNFHIGSKYKCETCVEAKLTRSSFKSVKQKTEPLDMIHTDICDLKSLTTKGGNKYFITFIDDCTKYCYVYLLKSKDEAIDKFVLYKTKVENGLGRKIKVVRSDRWGKYVSPFVELYAKHVTKHEFTAPCSPQQDDIAKRKNRTLQEMETRSSSRLDEEVIQDKRKQDDNDLYDETISTQGKRENEPTSYRETVTSSEGHQWKEAIKSDIDSILQNHTWEVVELPTGCNQLGYKWIFKKKMKVDGTIDKMILAIVALRNLEVHQMDVKTAFLIGDLEEEIYTNQPEGLIAPGQEGKVCRLVKSLYGLKQAPKQWNQKFDHTMLESGFKINECDKRVYVKDTNSGYVILCLYVDDILIIGSNDKIINSTKDMLKSKFDMKDMGLADVILGIKIIRSHNGLVLSQAHYVEKFLILIMRGIPA
nr:retrotransposon protein, putative, Ty1-copia subclass [Tanacetum cinerariifolium]